MLGKQEPVVRGACWSQAAGLEVRGYTLDNEATQAARGVKVVVNWPREIMQIGRED